MNVVVKEYNIINYKCLDSIAEENSILERKPKGIIEKHLRWLKDAKLITKIGIGILDALGLILLSPIIAIPILIKAYKIQQKIAKEEKWKQKLAEAQPPSDEPFYIKTEKRAFSHTHDYAIENGIIWCRQQKGDWKPIFFDGTPEKISADGANLIVIDTEGHVHYKKTIKEFRPEEIGLQPSKNRHISEDTPKDKYLAVDKATLNNWKEAWFSLPVVRHIANLFTGKKLRLPTNAKSIVISHRGRYNNYTEDKMGRKHHVTTGVTTLYVLGKNGNKIRKYDPWSPIWAKTEIFFPETDKSLFNAEQIDASASHIAAIGYETNLETKEQKLKIITRLADIDTDGGNPSLSYTFDDNTEDADTRILPVATEWREHPLPEGATVSKNISIVQIGEGNPARELRLEGSLNDKKGYFAKKLTEDAWAFKEQEIGDFEPISASVAVTKDINENVNDVSGKIILKNTLIDNIQVKNFGKHSTVSKITYEGHELFLYRRYTMWSFLSIDKKRYDLIIPQGLREKFGGKSSIEVTTKMDKKGKLIIKS